VDRLNRVRRAAVTLTLLVLSMFVWQAPAARASERVSNSFCSMERSIFDQIRPIGDRRSPNSRADRTINLRIKPLQLDIRRLDSKKLPEVGFRRCFSRQGRDAHPATSVTMTPCVYDAPNLLRFSHLLMATNTPGAGAQLFDNLAPGDMARAYGFESIPTSKLGNLTGRFNYVVLEDGTLVVAKRSYGHIDLSNGAPVQAAGEVHIVNGQVRGINNASGHYKPHGSGAQRAAEDAFGSSGVNVRPGSYSETKR
jgi:hypothetical protein